VTVGALLASGRAALADAALGRLPGEPLAGDWTVLAPSDGHEIWAAGVTFAAYTIGNDMSSRSIEGENPLYLPQAKVYDASCGLGPCLVTTEEARLDDMKIRLDIDRAGARLSPVAPTCARCGGDRRARAMAHAGADVSPRRLPLHRYVDRARPRSDARERGLGHHLHHGPR
jgi:hypothetical protein